MPVSYLGASRLDGSCETNYRGVRPETAAVTSFAANFPKRAIRLPEPRDHLSFGGLLVGILWLFALRSRASLAQVWRRATVPLRRLARRVLDDLIRRSVRALAPVSLLGRLGVVAIIALLPYGDEMWSLPDMSRWTDLRFLLLAGMLGLAGFLWLCLTGTFGYGSATRADWPALVGFLIALAIREGYARHGVHQLQLYFFYGSFPDRHSVLYPLLVMFLQPLGRDPYELVMHANGVLGALATLPLYVFVRQRTNDHVTAFAVTAFFAVHPLLVQFAPTDGPYSLLLLTWFSGLALLTAPEVGARQLFAGTVLLAIAATCRAEGALYLLASLLLVDVRSLLGHARRELHAAVSAGLVLLALVAVHVIFCFPIHLQQDSPVGTFTVVDVLLAWIFPFDYNDAVFVGLVILGGIAGLVDARLRLGLAAVAGTLVVVWPVSTPTLGFWAVHRLVPACALQVIAAGVGTSWLRQLVPTRLRRHGGAAIPAATFALLLFARTHDEVRDQNAITDEFWLLRDHLAPSGVAKGNCTLLALGRRMDTDFHDLSQIVPGMTFKRCELEDCSQVASGGGCLYYLRSLNCYNAKDSTPGCRAQGGVPEGDRSVCLDARCARLESALQLEVVEERTVDLYAAFHNDKWPMFVDIGLYRVVGGER